MRKILEYLRSWELVDINQTGGRFGIPGYHSEL